MGFCRHTLLFGVPAAGDQVELQRALQFGILIEVVLDQLVVQVGSLDLTDLHLFDTCLDAGLCSLSTCSQLGELLLIELVHLLELVGQIQRRDHSFLEHFVVLLHLVHSVSVCKQLTPAVEIDLGRVQRVVVATQRDVTSLQQRGKKVLVFRATDHRLKMGQRLCKSFSLLHFDVTVLSNDVRHLQLLRVRNKIRNALVTKKFRLSHHTLRGGNQLNSKLVKLLSGCFATVDA
mmetsp:Transcript_14159/g.36130  ORF Transcript_14159/g.36130 Transcript_14159/m.36130 type:complete len:233 (-) Transcript_14159:197-895(-)